MNPNRVLLIFALFWMAVAIALLFCVEGQYALLQSKQETIRELAKEISWQRYEVTKAQMQVPEYQEFKYLSGVMETRDRNLHAIAKAAWKWGKVYVVSPDLILSVIHRESFFDPSARSFDKDGMPLAYGAMQVNYRVWKTELNLDISKMDEIDYNIKQGTIILKYYLDRNPGDLGAALFQYWGGSLAGGSYTYPVRVLNSSFFNGTVQ